MKKNFDPLKNYEATKEKVGYVPRKEATQATYDRIGFMSGLEVHQQLKTKKKLFCNCPAGIYNDNSHFDAEVVRHMRPTLSELGEYDGTALMEFKTKKTIIYKLKNETTCTYEVDDTPPFPINREALDIAIEISLLSKLNIVGEVHITRKQYLDGSIPTGFQRTAIIGVEGEIPIKNKMIRLIQLSIEEDSCREISDIGHVREYKTDRLGMPLIETVTYPDMVNPDEVKEACDYIRFLNRSTNKVRTGIGAGREDVNVSCKGGTRVEIKGVAHTKLIPELTHNECFRQWSLLQIREILNKRIKIGDWKMSSKKLNFFDYDFVNPAIIEANNRKNKFIAVNLPEFKGVLSHFTQPDKCFVNELSDRLKVIACIEKPNIITSEDIHNPEDKKIFTQISELLNSGENDAQVIFWAPEEDIATALDVIDERCKMAFKGVPNETRKYLLDGTTIFERVLPGADRMYPDTDSAPIPLDNQHLEKLQANLPNDIYERTGQLVKWNAPEDTFTFIHVKNLFPVIEKITNKLNFDPKFISCFMGHRLKFIEGHYSTKDFDYNRIFDMFEYINKNKLEKEIAYKILPVLYQHPQMDFDSILTTINFKKLKSENIVSNISMLKKKYDEIGRIKTNDAKNNWIMGQLNNLAVGNISMNELNNIVNGN
ncbi:MAG: Glu-tRNA(Gln) amidotransferase subunit GatE [Bacteroidales bacterium]|jgi:glutamyl-tRNA(Gln) amidotransferase subunit E|nr:Glu-tRNA(Gln) amidotransferase subunit GatE [Bacteroidales bacterium]